WLGFEHLRVEARRIAPITGDLHFSMIELVEPFARARTRDGALEFFSLRFPSATPEAEGTAPTAAEAESPASEPVADAEVETESEVRPAELRVDQVLISGMDVRYTDFDAEPVARVPLTDLDLEVRNWTNRRQGAVPPLTFSALVGAGEVELPAPIKTRGGFIGGLAMGAMNTVTGKREEPELEERLLFREVGLSGRVSQTGAPTGWVRAHVVGFELLSLRGLARKSGVEIGGGILDLNVRTRLEGEDGIEIESTTTLDQLSLSEPPGGPISKYLKLPAPLDSVLFVLRDQSGEIRLPVDVSIDPDGRLSSSQLATEISTALAKVIADAVKGSPMRLAGTLTGLVGIGGGDEDADSAPIESSAGYTRGATQLDSEAVSVLDAALDALVEDDALELIVEQQLGSEDLEQTERLANPTREETVALADRLERRLNQLERDRAVLAAEARTLLLVGRDDDADRRTGELRLAETRIGLLERALDNLYGRLRPGADRRSDRRAREAAVRLGELRQEAILSRVAERGDAELMERIDLRPTRVPREEPPATGSLRLAVVRRR
ncbi:MAG: hypothetical protein AAFZ65_19700, partial [Planctomycetota bacterium]